MKEVVIMTKTERVEELKERTQRCRCKYCGGKLELRKIIYGDLNNARVEIFCHECDRIEFGVEKEIYQIAKYFVEELDFNVFPDLDYSDKIKSMNIAKICEIISWGCKNLSLLDVNGFKYPVIVNTEMEGECLKITQDSLLSEIKKLSR